MLTKYAVFVLVYCSFSRAQADLHKSCDTVCYQNVNRTHSHLLETINRLNETVTKANFPEITDLERLREILKQFKATRNSAEAIDSHLKREIPKLQTCLLNYTANKNSTDFLSKILKNVSHVSTAPSHQEFNDILRKLKEIYENYRVLENATCEESGEYKKLLEDFKVIEKLFENQSKSYSNVSRNAKKLNKTIEMNVNESISIKNDLGSLKMPLYLLDKYIEGSKTKLDGLMKNLRENRDILEELLENLVLGEDDIISQILKEIVDSVKVDLDRIAENVSAYEREIKEALREYKFNEFSPDDVKNIFKEIELALDDLEKKLKSVEHEVKHLEEQNKEIEKLEYELENNVFPSLDNATHLLQDFIEIVDVLPGNKKEFEQIQYELRKSKQTLLLIHHKDSLEMELKELEKIVNEMRDSKKCPSNIHLEN